MKFVACLAVAAAGCVLATPAPAQYSKPEDAVKYRQSVMFVMSQHVGRLDAMAKGRVPYDARMATENAEVVAEMSHLPWPAFMPNTDKAAQTRAKPNIWAEPARFRETNEKLMAESGRLLAAAKTNNLDNLKKAFADTAATCKACHDTFRRD